MRSRVLFLSLIFALGSFVLPAVAHASIPYFGPIVPNTDNCPAGWGLLIIVINNIISVLLTLAIVFFMPIMVAYAGFLYVVNPANPGGIDKAKSILLNTIMGIVIALAAWMIVDALMAVLYNGNFGAWSSIITSNGNDLCFVQAGTPTGAGLNQTPPSVGTNGVINPPPTSGNCTPSSLIAAGISPSIATQMSCIAEQESTCNLTATNPKSSATGLFQVVFGYNNTGHNLNFPVCTQAAQAAGYQITGNLDCHTSVLAGGAPNPNNINLFNACRAAASNIDCNAQAAQWLYTNNGGFTNWVSAPKCGL